MTVTTVIAGHVKHIRTTVERGKVPLRGSIGVSVEEGLLRSIAADATGDTDNALYDQTLTRASGAGLLFNQVVRRMSHAVVSGSSDAVLSVLRRL